MADWKSLVTVHRAKQQDSIPSAWTLNDDKLKTLSGIGTAQDGRLVELQVARQSGLLSIKELDITENHSASSILQLIRAQELTAEERAALANQLTSCLTEIFFDEAIERAKSLDQTLRQTGQVVGPLNGLPASFKDCFHIRNHYATAGFVEYLKRPPPTDDAALVKILVDAGAVLYCKTNVPQTMMTADSENNIFGRTLNSIKSCLTAGGSSGGEGALVSFRGSVLGIGNDLAGSVRIPATCCGIYGFKPTANRIPFGGQTHFPFPVPWLSSMLPVVGPLAHSAVLWNYDSTSLNIPWRRIDVKLTGRWPLVGWPKTLTIPCTPPSAVHLRKPSLSCAARDTTLPNCLLPPSEAPESVPESCTNFFCLGADDTKDLWEVLGEPLVTSLSKVEQFHGLNVARASYAEAWKQTWLDNNLISAVPHDTFGVPIYTVMWSVLDYPAAVIPFSTASKEKDGTSNAAAAPFTPDYTLDAIDSAPCSIQIVAPTLRDEEC
ncbi:amidase signature domain-containing protein [Thelonectria olida]|uniref:amidase n=1 Tax=Thelonectria olida TaxID=1576542 RepID=A0A9P8VYE2_9HYPO|nr:amidase signature domain-containing protein [Thelonectria olida]